MAFGVIGYKLAFAKGQLFREGLFQFMTSFSLPWYAIAGASAAVTAGLPVLGVLLIAVIGPTAGRYYIDVTSGVPPKQFIRGEWFVGIALLTGLAFVVCDSTGLGIWWCAGIAFVIGFTVRAARSLSRLGRASRQGAGRASTSTATAARCSDASSRASPSGRCTTSG